MQKKNTKKKVEKTLKIEIDDEAFDRLFGHISHPIEIKKKRQKIAVRIISQFGEESTKVMGCEPVHASSVFRKIKKPFENCRASPDNILSVNEQLTDFFIYIGEV